MDHFKVALPTYGINAQVSNFDDEKKGHVFLVTLDDVTTFEVENVGGEWVLASGAPQSESLIAEIGSGIDGYYM
nr:hypothetical protein [Pseudopedobacter sp.]